MRPAVEAATLWAARVLRLIASATVRISPADKRRGATAVGGWRRMPALQSADTPNLPSVNPPSVNPPSVRVKLPDKPDAGQAHTMH